MAPVTSSTVGVVFVSPCGRRSAVLPGLGDDRCGRPKCASAVQRREPLQPSRAESGVCPRSRRTPTAWLMTESSSRPVMPRPDLRLVEVAPQVFVHYQGAGIEIKGVAEIGRQIDQGSRAGRVQHERAAGLGADQCGQRDQQGRRDARPAGTCPRTGIRGRRASRPGPSLPPTGHATTGNAHPCRPCTRRGISSCP